MRLSSPLDLRRPERRRFVQGLAAGGVLYGLSPLTRAAASLATSAPVLSGTEFELEVRELPVNFTGKPRMATAVNGSIPAPTLRWREGETVTIRVTNRLPVATSIHWHGIIVPYQMDGVPGISFRGIAPGETFTYRFKVKQSGTYWYHSHSGHQEQTGMYGAIIVEPRGGERLRADREHVVLLSDWTDEDPDRVLAKLKAQSDYYNYHQPTAADFFRDASREGLKAAVDRRGMWNRMRMSPTDLADLSGATLTYLMNGAPPAANWTGLFRPGERVRLRFINGAANSFYDVRIPGLKLLLVQADGTDIEPVSVDEFRFGPGETYDVIVQPQDMPYTLFAQAMDRTGYARGTLAPRQGLSAPVPQMDPRPWLGMEDMMGGMAPMSGMAGMAGMQHGAMGAMDHGGMAGMMPGGMSGMSGMTGMTGMTGMSHGAMPGKGAMAMEGALTRPSARVRHARTEYGASTDMRVDTPRPTSVIPASACAATAAACSPWPTCRRWAGRWTRAARSGRSSCT